MGRWRPPAEKSTALITAQGHARLKAELDELWRVKRPEVVRALAAAAAEGDRSENAEYTYRKKQLGEIDRRVRYLSKRLESLRVVDDAPAEHVGGAVAKLLEAVNHLHHADVGGARGDHPRGARAGQRRDTHACDHRATRDSPDQGRAV